MNNTVRFIGCSEPKILNDQWIVELKSSLKKGRIKMFFSKMIKNKTASEIKRLEDEINRLRVEVGALRYSYSALEGTLEVHKCLSPFVEYKLFSPNYGSSSDKAQLIKDGYELCGISNINKAEVWKKK